MRKFWLAHLAEGLAILPGGFGTLDELFELLILAQTQKLAKRIIILIYGCAYRREIINLERLAEWGAINSEDLELFKFVDSPEEGFGVLKEHLEWWLVDSAPHRPARLHCAPAGTTPFANVMAGECPGVSAHPRWMSRG
jgi:hypothetical protein